MDTPTKAIALAARNLANNGAVLVEALRDALSEADRAQFEGLELAGAEVAVTVKWTGDRCEVRVGLVTGDGQPLGVLALDFPRVAPAEH